MLNYAKKLKSSEISTKTLLKRCKEEEMKTKKPLNSSELRAELKAILRDMVRAYEGKPQPVANYNLANYAVKIEDLVEEQKRLTEIEVLNHALEYMGQFPDFNLANMYEYIREKEKEFLETSER